MPGDTLPHQTTKAILKLTYTCNSRCRFCRVENHRGTVADIGAEDVLRKTLMAREAGVEMILFSGGEPTLRRDLPLLAKAVTRLGLSWGLITNGSVLSSQRARTALLDLGLAYIHTSLHGASSQTHDYLTQNASFEPVMATIQGLVGLVELHVNTVITRPNIGELAQIGDLLATASGGHPLTHKLCLMEPNGMALEFYHDLVVQPDVAGRAAEEQVKRTLARPNHNVDTQIEGFPLCQVRHTPDAVGNLHTHGIRYMSEAHEDQLFVADNGPRVFLDPCDNCSARAQCPGIYPEYANKFGVVGIRAFRR